MTDESWTQLGEIDVHAGMVMIGDPCYTLPGDGSRRTEEIASLEAFCKLLDFTNNGSSEPAGEGVGMVIRVAAGDGPTRSTGRAAQEVG